MIVENNLQNNVYHFCAYSNKKYEKSRKSLINLAGASGIFSKIFEYDRDWLESTDFYNENLEILADPNSKGDGWCLWKPYIILESLKNIKDGEILLYMDSSDTFFGQFKNFLDLHFSKNDLLIVGGGENPNGNYTKRDTFVFTNCDSLKYWKSLQIEAGIIGIKKSRRTIKFIEEYLNFCKDPRILKNSPNVSGRSNLPQYIDHRYDQSVLSILVAKYKIIPSSTVRDFVECNIWESLHYWGNPSEYYRKKQRIIGLIGKNYENFYLWIREYEMKLN